MAVHVEATEQPAPEPSGPPPDAFRRRPRSLPVTGKRCSPTAGLVPSHVRLNAARPVGVGLLPDPDMCPRSQGASCLWACHRCRLGETPAPAGSDPPLCMATVWILNDTDGHVHAQRRAGVLAPTEAYARASCPVPSSVSFFLLIVGDLGASRNLGQVDCLIS